MGQFETVFSSQGSLEACRMLVSASNELLQEEGKTTLQKVEAVGTLVSDYIGDANALQHRYLGPREEGGIEYYEINGSVNLLWRELETAQRASVSVMDTYYRSFGEINFIYDVSRFFAIMGSVVTGTDLLHSLYMYTKYNSQVRQAAGFNFCSSKITKIGGCLALAMGAVSLIVHQWRWTEFKPISQDICGSQ